jgi:hypothetical protein
LCLYSCWAEIAWVSSLNSLDRQTFSNFENTIFLSFFHFLVCHLLIFRKNTKYITQLFEFIPLFIAYSIA